MQTADAAKSEHDAVGERTNLIVRGLPAGITEAILFQALQHNPSIQSIRIVPNSKNDSSARTGVVAFTNAKMAEAQIRQTPALLFGAQSCPCSIEAMTVPTDFALATRERRGKRNRVIETAPSSSPAFSTSRAGGGGTRPSKRSRGGESAHGGRLSYVGQRQMALRTVFTPEIVLHHVRAFSDQGQPQQAYLYLLEHLEVFTDRAQLESVLNPLLVSVRAYWSSLSPRIASQAGLNNPVQISFNPRTPSSTPFGGSSTTNLSPLSSGRKSPLNFEISSDDASTSSTGFSTCRPASSSSMHSLPTYDHPGDTVEEAEPAGRLSSSSLPTSIALGSPFTSSNNLKRSNASISTTSTNQSSTLQGSSSGTNSPKVYSPPTSRAIARESADAVAKMQITVPSILPKPLSSVSPINSLAASLPMNLRGFAGLTSNGSPYAPPVRQSASGNIPSPRNAQGSGTMMAISENGPETIPEEEEAAVNAVGSSDGLEHQYAHDKNSFRHFQHNVSPLYAHAPHTNLPPPHIYASSSPVAPPHLNPVFQSHRSPQVPNSSVHLQNAGFMHATNVPYAHGLPRPLYHWNPSQAQIDAYAQQIHAQQESQHQRDAHQWVEARNPRLSGHLTSAITALQTPQEMSAHLHQPYYAVADSESHLSSSENSSLHSMHSGTVFHHPASLADAQNAFHHHAEHASNAIMTSNTSTATHSAHKTITIGSCMTPTSSPPASSSISDHASHFYSYSAPAASSAFGALPPSPSSSPPLLSNLGEPNHFPISFQAYSPSTTPAYFNESVEFGAALGTNSTSALGGDEYLQWARED